MVDIKTKKTKNKKKKKKKKETVLGSLHTHTVSTCQQKCQVWKGEKKMNSIPREPFSRSQNGTEIISFAGREGKGRGGGF